MGSVSDDARFVGVGPPGACLCGSERFGPGAASSNDGYPERRQQHRFMSQLALLDAFLELHNGNRGDQLPGAIADSPDDFLTFCQHHQIAAYVWSQIEETDLAEKLEPMLRAGLQYAQLDQWQRSERLLRELQRLDAGFSEAGIEFIAIKGPSLAQRFFGGIDRRAFTDLDILVRAEGVPASVDFLKRRGFEAVSSSQLPGWMRRFLHHVELRKDTTILDLHHTIRSHPAVRISQETLWEREKYLDFPNFRCRVLPDDLSLLVQILSIHTDIALGVANLKMLVDLDRVLRGCYRTIDWPAFLSDRREDGTFGITLNVFALLLTIFRNAARYPEIARLLEEHRDLLVWPPDRDRYLRLFVDATLYQSKIWALRQYDQSIVSSVMTWAMSLPVMALGMRDSFMGNLRQRGFSRPRSRGERESSAGLWDSRQQLVRGLGGDPDAIRSCRIKLGSLSLEFSYTDEKHLTMLRDLFRLLPIEAGSAAWDGMDHLLIFDVDEEQFREVIPQPSQPLVDRSLEGILEIHRDAACCLLRRTPDGLKLAIPVISAPHQYEHLLHCVMVVLYRGLFALESLQLHAAAIQFGDSANLFIGDKGAGKSTVSLSLGLAGGRVLAEDHILLRRAEGSFVVSGCDGMGRLTAKTENYFFAKPLPSTPVDVAGTLKKEIELADHVSSAPFEEVPVGRVFFVHVGEQLSMRRMKGNEALLKLIEMMRERQRFVGARDRGDFLDYFGDFLESTEVWDLTLSPDLNELDELAKFVKGGGSTRLDEMT